MGNMPVNLEVKGSLAKCLATENLIIEHKQVSTACFDVDKRILTLPMWEKASNVVYDLLVGHEVGHALFTDNIDWTVDYPELPKSFVNVVEDTRVERLMKKKYPGLSRSFYNGYNELNDQNFFSTQGEELNKLSFIDRINLYFKIGAFHNINFTDDENEFITRITKLETFKEVLDLCRDLVKFLNYKREKISNTVELGNNPESNGGSGDEYETDSTEPNESNEEQEQGDSETEESTQGESSESKSEEQEADVSTSSEASRGGKDQNQEEVDEMESKTSESFDEKSKELTSKSSSENIYVEIPDIKLDKVIIPNDHIHKLTNEFWLNCKGAYMADVFKIMDSEYKQYKSQSEKEVSYLVKEFECKKSADQYARSSTSSTGILDTTKLHTYKYNEDLFKKVSVIPDGKNHGLIFILDWSGSMGDWILDTVKQLFNLIWFCKKVNIPFDVYAFTVDPSSYVQLQPDHPQIAESKENFLAVEKSFRLMNFFTSKVNSRELETQMKNIWRCAYAFQKRIGSVPPCLSLSGSPIGESIMTLHNLIPDFQTRNKLQKVNVIFLTDGEGYVNCVTKKKNVGLKSEYMGISRTPSFTIRDKKTGRVYPTINENIFSKYSKILLTTLKDRFPEVNLINFRICESRSFSSCYHWYGEGNDWEKVKSTFSKQRFVSFSNTGYDQFNIIANDSLSQSGEFKVEKGSSNTVIKTAFTKVLAKKRTNKKLLSSFIDLIA